MRRLAWGVVLALGAAASYACVGDDSQGTPDASLDATADTTAKDNAVDDVSQGTDASDGGTEAAPSPVTRVFVSSKKYYGDSIGGVAQADTDCQLLATAASRGTGWKAWLSSTTSNAKDRLVLGSGKIMLVDGLTTVVAKGTDLVGDGGLVHAIDHDENNASVAPTIVWTGTTEHGVVYASNGAPCGDWTSPDGGAAAGASNQTGITWTSDAIEPCTNSYPIYCFGP
jgi:hypothetical protein